MTSPEVFTEAAKEYRAHRSAVRPKAVDPVVEAAFAGEEALFTHLWHAIEAAHAAIIAAELGDVSVTRACLDRLVGHVRLVARVWNSARGTSESEQ